jgi:hypothetical protein
MPAMRIVPTLVAYYTADWIRVAITSYLHHFPDDRVLVVDNNPRRGEVGWVPDCERERHWLKSHPRVDYLFNTLVPCRRYGDRPHGLGIDAALEWCRGRGADALLHFEPDCLVMGRRWRENLLEALARGAWMAGSVRKDYGPIHPTPSAWRVEQARTSFSGQERAPDARHPRYHSLVDIERLKAEVVPLGDWPWWERFWDTGEKAWFDAAKQDHTALVEAPDFRHYWNGSTAQRMDLRALIARHPELEPWFREADATIARRRVEHCPFREQVRSEGDREVARCNLLGQLSGIAGGPLCDVRRDACETCCASFPPTPSQPNPAVAGLLYRLCEQVIERGGIPGVDAEKAAKLGSWAEQHLEYCWEEAPRASSAREADGSCIHFGDPVGFRPVATAHGFDQMIFYKCRHPDHRETTPEQCLRCRDWSDSGGPPPAPLVDLVPAPACRHGARVGTWAVGVITAPRRKPTLDDCLDSLIRAGWERPRLFVDSATTIATRHEGLPITLREPRIGAWPNYYLALVELQMREPEADAYMLVEDDVIFFDRQDLRAYLEDVLWPADPCGAVSLYCSSVYTQPEPGWHEFAGEWVWGALAFIFPRESVRQLIGDPGVLAHRTRREEGLEDTDALIGRWSHRRGLPIHYPTPSLVQHIGDTSSLWPAMRALGFRRADRFAGDAE